jgi:predicted ABC-type ATPase
MNHIFNPRGTNGSGKTTIVRAVTAKLTKLKDYTTRNGVFTTIYTTPKGEAVAVIGKYNNTCGGCDTVKRVRDVIDAIAEVSLHAHVLFEGLIVGSLQQLTKDIADACPHAVLHARALSTTPDECIERVLARRVAAGNDKPFDPTKSLLTKVKPVISAARKLDEWGLDSKIVSQQACFDEICETLGLEKSSVF